MNRSRFVKPDDNTIAHILAVTAMTFIMLVACGLGRPADATEGSRPIKFVSQQHN